MLLCLSLTLFASAQIETQEPHPSERAIARLVQFDAEEQAEMVADIMSFIWDTEHPKLAATRHLLAEYRVPRRLTGSSFRHYSAEKYAPALGLRTRVRKHDSRSWKSFADKYRAQGPEFDQTRWQWSSGMQLLVGPTQRIDAAGQIRALAAGQIPEFTLWAALLESKLDTNPRMHAISDYFEHSYRNRKGEVYAGLTLGQMWGSQREFGISDVEAIAFLRELHDETSLQSPIPGSMHDRLYDRIRDAYAEYREYHQIRRTLAIVYFDPEGPVPIVMRSVAPRLDLAWAIVNDDPQRMVEWLDKHPKRKAFLASVEEEIAKRLTEGVSEESLRLQRGPLGPILAQQVMAGLRREGLLGLRGR